MAKSSIINMITGTSAPAPEQVLTYIEQLGHLNKLSDNFSTALDNTLNSAKAISDKKSRRGSNKVTTADYERFFGEELRNIDQNALVLITGDKTLADRIDAEDKTKPDGDPSKNITNGNLRSVFEPQEAGQYLLSAEYKDPTTNILRAVSDKRDKLRKSLEMLDKDTIDKWTPEQKKAAGINSDPADPAVETKSIAAFLARIDQIINEAKSKTTLRQKAKELDRVVKQLNPREQEIRERKMREGRGTTSKYNENGLKHGLIFGSIEFIVKLNKEDPEKTTVYATGLPLFSRGDISAAKAMVRAYLLAKHEAYDGKLSMKEILDQGIEIQDLQVGTCPQVLLDFLANVQAVAEGLGIPREKVKIHFDSAKAHDGRDDKLTRDFHARKERYYLNKLEGKGGSGGAIGRVNKHIDKIISNNQDSWYNWGTGGAHKVLPPDIVEMTDKSKQRTEAFRTELLGSAYYTKSTGLGAEVAGKGDAPAAAGKDPGMQVLGTVNPSPPSKLSH